MEALNNVYAASNELRPLDSPVIDNVLVKDVFCRILGSLKAVDLQSTAEVSQYWNRCTILGVKNREYFLIVNFAKSLGLCLNEETYPDQRKRLFNIENDKEIFVCNNLIQIKSFALRIEENIMNILEEVHELDIEVLKFPINNLISPKFFGNFEYWADNLQRKRKKNNLLTPYFPPNRLVKMGFSEKVLDMADMITDISHRDHCLGIISGIYLLGNEVDRAIKAANKRSAKGREDSLFKEMCQFLLEKGDIDTALQVANMMITGLSDIFYIFRSNKNLDQMFIILKMMRTKGLEREFKVSLCDLVAFVLKDLEIERSLEFARMISSKEIRMRMLDEINAESSESSNDDPCFEIAHLIQDDSKLRFILLVLITVGVFDKDFEKGFEVADLVPDDSLIPNVKNGGKTFVLQLTTLNFIEIGDTEKALKVANRIPIDGVRIETIENVRMGNSKFELFAKPEE